MYTIIGNDRRQYGPISAAQIRQWAAEGRVNHHTLVWTEGAAAWKPLSEFPELAMASPPAVPPAPLPPPVMSPPVGKSKLTAGLLGILLGAWGVHRFYLGYVNVGLLQILVSLLTCGIGGLWGFIEGIMILTGSIHMDAQGNPLRD